MRPIHKRMKSNRIAPCFIATQRHGEQHQQNIDHHDSGQVHMKHEAISSLTQLLASTPERTPHRDKSSNQEDRRLRHLQEARWAEGRSLSQQLPRVSPEVHYTSNKQQNLPTFHSPFRKSMDVRLQQIHPTRNIVDLRRSRPTVHRSKSRWESVTGISVVKVRQSQPSGT